MEIQQSKKIVFNTLVLYAKVIISLVVSLATTKLVLTLLGVEQFGLYNLIVGMIAMISFVNLAMTTSTLRYNSYYLNKPEARTVFNNSIILHIYLAALILIFLEFVGVFFIQNILNIPSHQLSVAQIIYQFVIIGSIVQIITVPYDSLINAHEDMVAFSVIAIIENFIKLLGACALFYIESDRLIIYSIFISIAPIFTFVAKYKYCKNNYSEAQQISFKIPNKIKFKEMGFFAFWNMFGAFSNTAKNQGIAMVLNVFFGVIVNAAYGISQQINNLCLILSASLQKSLNPVILKSEGAGNRESTIKYGLAQCRISTFLVSLIVIPIYFNLPFILQLWLGEIPEYTISLCKWLIILTIIMQLTTGVQVAIQSVGRIKVYQIVMSSLILLNIPFSILFLHNGYEPDVVFKIAIVIEFVCIYTRLLFSKRLLSLKLETYFRDVIIPFFVVCIAFIISWILKYYFSTNNMVSTIINIGFSSTVLLALIWFFGMKQEEKAILKKHILRK